MKKTEGQGTVWLLTSMLFTLWTINLNWVRNATMKSKYSHQSRSQSQLGGQEAMVKDAGINDAGGSHSR
jgi:hypothetical protein